jgi:hypothetical protein
MSLGACGLLGFAGLDFLAAERVRLAMSFAAGFVQPLAEFPILFFHLGRAADQAVVLAPEGRRLLAAVPDRVPGSRDTGKDPRP